jgi:Tat protein secretion system quality control protein TatD with DNase activity
MPEEEDFPWQLGVYDAHCHPTDTLSSLDEIQNMKARTLTIMATRAQDQELVADAAERFKSTESQLEKVVASFGWHPWFSHLIFDDTESDIAKSESDKSVKETHYESVLTPSSMAPEFLDSLPNPTPLSGLLSSTKRRLEKFPRALVGEIGLDKSFRLPNPRSPNHETVRDSSLTPGGREGRLLSPHRVKMAHQKRIFQAQLKLAGEMQRPVSVHGVQAHGIVFETLQETWVGYEKKVMSKRERERQERERRNKKSDVQIEENRKEGAENESKPFPPRICLHSYSGSPDTVKQYFEPSIPAEVYLSFSDAVNLGTQGEDKTKAAIKAVPDNRLLIESDLHIAGGEMDRRLEEIARMVCKVKGWKLNQGVKILANNYLQFIGGTVVDGSTE